MFYNVLKAKDLVDLNGEKYVKKVLMEDGDGKLAVIALKKDETLDSHTCPRDSAVLVIDGEIEMHFNAEKFEIEKGEVIMFKKDAEHIVRAKKDSKFLIFKI